MTQLVKTETKLASWSMNPTSMAEAMELAKWLAQSDMVPKDYRGKPANCLMAIGMGAELGLSAMQALQSIACINGKPSLYGDGFLAVAQRHPDFIDMLETLSGEGDAMVATCTVKRRGRSDVISTFSVADARQAKLWNKEGPWSLYPPRMLKMRARGFAVRDAFADALRGIISDDEANDYPTRETRNVTPDAHNAPEETRKGPHNAPPNPRNAPHNPDEELPVVAHEPAVEPDVVPTTDAGVDWFSRLNAASSMPELIAVGEAIKAAKPPRRPELAEAYRVAKARIEAEDMADKLFADADNYNHG